MCTLSTRSPPQLMENPPINPSNGSKLSYVQMGAVSIPTWGGGDHGYLGLVLSDQEYARIQPTPTPFVAPNFPGALIVDPALTAVQQVQERETHKEQVALYRECKNVEKALLRHIQQH